MRAELADPNYCAVLVLSRAAVNLSWYDSRYEPESAVKFMLPRQDIWILFLKRVNIILMNRKVYAISW